MALERLPARDRAAFLRAYGRGSRSTARDVALVRRLLREHVLGAMNERIESNVAAALEALERVPFRESGSKRLLGLLAKAQLARVA